MNSPDCSNPRILKVGLLWHSTSSDNLGVLSLTAANISLACRAAARIGVVPTFVVMGMRDGGIPQAPDDSIETLVIDTRSMFSPAGYWSFLDRVDCLLDIGGGDSFSDIYGAKRFGFLWLSKVLALLKKKPLLLCPQTIGPFTKTPFRQLAAAVLNRVDTVVARDPLSLEAIRSLAPAARAIQSVDVAFALPYVPPALSERGKTRVGINVSGLLFHESVSGRNRFGLDYDYAALMRMFLEYLSLDGSLAIELICHVSAPDQLIDDDARVADLLTKEFPNAIRVPAFSSPFEAKSHISGLDFLVAGRMHACIAAYSCGVPFVATSYSRKFTGLFGMLNYSGIVPENGMNTSAALQCLIEGVKDRDHLAAEIDAGNRDVDALLKGYEDALADFFQSVCEGA